MALLRRIARWTLEALLIALLAVAVTLVGLTRVAPALGHPVLIIRTGSMSPTIPVGAAVILDSGSAGVRPGDVVAMQLDNGAVFTHRVTRLVSLDGGAYIETKGDANPSVDPALTPLTHVIGRVSSALPAVGFLMADLATPLGAAVALLAALTLLAALWLIDEGADEDEAEEERPAQQPVPSSLR
jgi:signal peptidase